MPSHFVRKLPCTALTQNYTVLLQRFQCLLSVTMISVVCQSGSTVKITSGQSNFTKAASPQQTDGSVVFARWRQCALPCPYTGATWQIRSNLCFLSPTRVHNPNSKSIGSAVFAQPNAESPYSLQWAPFPQKLLLPIGDLDPHLICDPFGASQPTTQTASRSVQPFLHSSQQNVIRHARSCPFP